MKKHLPILDLKAAFVDVGREHMHVSMGGDEPKVFGSVTSQLHALRDWLLSQDVRSVAMEATGVYWLPLYGVLEAAGLDVRMVNGRQTCNAPGRNTDMQDAQWGATLHMHGLLRAGFVPTADIRRLRDCLRLRADHVDQAGSCVQLMQKALERMNVKLHDAISSLAGASGMAVMRAIVAGERDPAVLLALCDVQIRRAKAEHVKDAARHLERRAHLRAGASAAELGPLPAADRRVRPAHSDCVAAARPDAARAGGPGQARRRQRTGDWHAARDHGADVQRTRPHEVARPHPVRRAADHRRDRHRPEQVGHREALQRLERAGARQQRQRQAAHPRQAKPKSRRATVLHAGQQPGAQQDRRAGRLLPAAGVAARQGGGHQGAGAQARGLVLARDGQG